MEMLRKIITVTPQQDAWIKSQINSGQYGMIVSIFVN